MKNAIYQFHSEPNLRRIADDINEDLGAGYAEAHPELIAACLQHQGLIAIARELRWLGHGDSARPEHGFGAVEGHTMRMADAIGDLAQAVREAK